jgi:hypothetical protein
MTDQRKRMLETIQNNVENNKKEIVSRGTSRKQRNREREEKDRNATLTGISHGSSHSVSVLQQAFDQPRGQKPTSSSHTH